MRARKLLTATGPVVALALALLALTSPTNAWADTGTVQIHCQPNLSERASVDPLEYYGIKRSPHNHTPAGAMAFSATATVRQMMAANTSCTIRADHSMLWIPTPLEPDGKPARITGFDYYLINSGYTIRRAPPDGLRFMAGDPHCTGQLCPAIYICRKWDGKILSLHTIPTRADGCDTSGGQGYGMTVYSPGQCWDGKSRGMGMGASTPMASITSAYPCHGWVIPRIVLGVSVGSDGLGGYLSSDIRAGTTRSSPGSTGHFDYVLGWKLRALGAVIKDCLNTTTFKLGEASCAEVTSPSRSASTIYQLPPPSQPWVHPKCVTGPSCKRRPVRHPVADVLEPHPLVRDLIADMSLQEIDQVT